MHEMMEDYLETWTIVRERMAIHTKGRLFLLGTRDREDWLNAITNHGIADALKNRDKWNREFPFSQFVFLRARTLARDELKLESDFYNAKKRLLVVEQSPPYQPDEYELILERDDIDWALRQMSQDQVEAIALRYESDLPVKTIARLLERTPNAVSVLLNRALARLKELLEERQQMPSPIIPELAESFSPTSKPRARSQLDDEQEEHQPSFRDNVIPFPIERGRHERA